MIDLIQDELFPDLPVDEEVVRRREDKNPFVREHGFGPDGAMCKTCQHLTRIGSYKNPKQYIKCKLRGVTNSSVTDHRVKWNACRFYEKAGENE